MPFGMVQLSPDNGRSGWDWVSGYHYSDSMIVGFSHTHLSGTGIGDLQDISIMPLVANADLTQWSVSRADKPYAALFSHANEQAQPGYYRVLLTEPAIEAELTATARTGFHRYTFKETGERNLLIDLGYAQNWDAPTDTEIEWVDAHTLKGKRISTGWANHQVVYFYMIVSEPILKVDTSDQDQYLQSGKITGTGVRVLLKFDKAIAQLKVKVALSGVSCEGAQKNMEAENREWDFEKVQQQASQAWSHALSRIAVKGGTDEQKILFYSALYRAQLAPTLHSDWDGRYRGADHQIHRADGYHYFSGLSLWDTFRTHNPLISILNPSVAGDIAKTMLAHHQETGILPVWVLAANETNCMTGYHSLPMLAEMVFKGIGQLDVHRVYAAMKHTLMQDQRGLKQVREQGYVPFDAMDESVTISLELAYNHYAAAMVAQKLGLTDDFNFFMNRSMAYRKLFDPEVGFMRGKDGDGKWRTPFDPKHSAHRVGTDYTEGNAWQHSWFVLHDVQGLIDLFGGDEPFVEKLNQLFAETSEITGDEVSPDITGLIGQYAHGNEPSHHIAYLYNYAGMPYKTQEMVHRILREQYFNTPDGISGNEDMGQMSAWYVMSALGFYPVNPVDGNYVLGTPLFPEATILLDNGLTFRIMAHGHSEANFYVEKVVLNGKPLDRTYITHHEIARGGTLEFFMSPEPNRQWGTAHTSRPPSLKLVCE